MKPSERQKGEQKNKRKNLSTYNRVLESPYPIPHLSQLTRKISQKMRTLSWLWLRLDALHPWIQEYSSKGHTSAERVDRRNRCPEEENRGDNNHHPLNTISNRMGNWGYPLQYHIRNLLICMEAECSNERPSVNLSDIKSSSLQVWRCDLDSFHEKSNWSQQE